MAIDKKILIEGFITETEEHLEAVNNAILILKENPSDSGSLSSLLRDLHTMKGTSRMLGFFTIEQLAHGLEDVFKGIREKKYEMTSRIVQLVLLTGDTVRAALAHIASTSSDEIPIDACLETFAKASAGDVFILDNIIKQNARIKDDVDAVDGGSGYGEVQTIRIKLDRINELIRSFDNLIIRQFKIKREIAMLEQEENRTQSRILRNIRKKLEEDLMQLESSVFSVQHQIFDLRMLPLEMVLNPLKRTIEMDALNSEKEIIFDVPKSEITLDKSILEPLTEILMHLVRNSLDHGIEKPQERTAAGKDIKGRIAVLARNTTNKIIITVSDDGKGIDFDRVREKAVERFPDQEHEIRAMKEKELSSFLYMSGFSTRDEATALSGRGVGLDVVRQNVEKIKGKINFETVRGKGTVFTITMPLSLATLQGLFIFAGGKKLLVPAQYVTEITSCSPSDYINLQNQNVIRLRDTLLPVYYLSTILGSSAAPIREKEKDTVLVVEYLDKSIGIIVDEVLENISVVVKPLPSSFKNFKALQGVVFDENYSIVPILHIPDIMTRMKSLVAYDLKKYEAKVRKREYHILVCDDSYTTRQIEKTILEAEGYDVDTAVDGIDALNKIKNKRFDALITDIKMPRMDGTVLIDNIRRSRAYDKMPIIVVSSVYDQELRKKFMEAGVQSYIVKSDFERGNLVSVLKELIHG